jgi:hypothetical protein
VHDLRETSPRSWSRETRFVAITGISVGIVAAVVLAALVLSGPPAPAPNSSLGTGNEVELTTVEWELGGLPCSGDPEVSTAPGTAVAPGAVFTENDSLVNAATLGVCVFADPAVSPGFSLVSSNLPLTLDAQGNATLTLTIAAPSSPWSGTLIVSVGVTTQF